MFSITFKNLPRVQKNTELDQFVLLKLWVMSLNEPFSIELMEDQTIQDEGSRAGGYAAMLYHTRERKAIQHSYSAQHARVTALSSALV